MFTIKILKNIKKSINRVDKFYNMGYNEYIIKEGSNKMNLVKIVYANGEIHESEVQNVDTLIHYIKSCVNAYGNNIEVIDYHKKLKENS